MSKRWGKALAGLVEGLTAPMSKWRRADTRLRAANALVQRHEVATRHGPLVFVSTNPSELGYSFEILRREPETIEWIDGFATPSVFWDIGANIGSYSLYAALRPRIEVLAFEPSAASYAALCGNLAANRLDDRVEAFCLALSGTTRLGKLNMSSTNAGGVFNAFESAEDCFGDPLDIVFRQSMIGVTIDDFRRLFRLPSPNYLKLDVDGTEEEILAGAAETLADPALRSVLIELEAADTERNRRLIGRLETAGFASPFRPIGEPGHVANAIFTRG